MATGDQGDIVNRLRLMFAFSWFSVDELPVFNTLLNGVAYPLSWIYQLYAYTLLQMRIATATGAWLDRISYDFLGTLLPRRSLEIDDPYRARVKKEIMRPRQTRAAIILALQDLTGKTPQIIEPWNANDCGAYGGPLGYGVGSNCYGSLSLNNQIFVTAHRAPNAGVPNVGGYGYGASGYHVAGEYADASQVVGQITDSMIYSAVAQVKAAGMTAWVAIES